MDRFKFFLERYKKECIAGVLFVILLIGGFGGFLLFRKTFQKTDTVSLLENQPLQNMDQEKQEKIVEMDDESVNIFRVDIKGEVNNPGVYLVGQDARVVDVIEKAGGLTKNADTKANNLSRKIRDEMVIVIYSKTEVEDFRKTKDEENTVLATIKEEAELFPNDALLKKEDLVDDSSSFIEHQENIKVDSSSESNSVESTNSDDVSKISINTATLEELMTLDGIGESKAKAIISYREEHGKFQKIEDIMQVSGIGEKMFEKIKESITV